MRFEAWQDDLRQRERIDPLPGKLARIGLAHDELLVEARIVRDEVAVARKFGERLDSFARGRSTGDVCLGDARELGDFGWNDASRVYEGLERADGLAPAHADGGDFEKRAA